MHFAFNIALTLSIKAKVFFAISYYFHH